METLAMKTWIARTLVVLVVLALGAAALLRVPGVQDRVVRAVIERMVVSQPDELFVRGAEQNKAKQLCSGCPVRTECLAEALDNQIEWGVWGGMTERERRALLRRRPTASWRAVLENAREAQTPVAPAAQPA